MNSFMEQEGEAFAELAYRSRWRYVTIACEDALLHDGFLTAFKVTHVDRYYSKLTVMHYHDLESASSAAVRLHGVVTSSSV